MGDLAHPAHVADVQQAVDAFLDLDEGPVIGEVADDAGNDGARRIALGHLVPGVGLDLLHAERDFLLVLVDVEHLDLDLVADGDQLAGMVDALGPAHLADVHQPLDAGFELDEGAVGHDVDDFARVPAVDGVLLIDVCPGAGRLLLEAEGDFFLVLVHGDDVDLELLVDLDDLVRVADAAPAHVGDVQQAVDAAQIDEGAELGDVLDDALAGLARLDLGQKFLFHLDALIFEELAPADDDVAAGLVDLEDFAFDGLADVLADVRRPADIDLAGGQEDVDADVDEQAALDLAGDGAGDHVAFLVLLDDLFPFLLALGLAIAEDDGADCHPRRRRAAPGCCRRAAAGRSCRGPRRTIPPAG